MTATVELRMPLGYIEMDAEEMEYLEGGDYVYKYLNRSTCQKISRALQVGGVLAGLLGTAASVAVGLVCLFGSWYFEDARSGVDIMKSSWGYYYLKRR